MQSSQHVIKRLSLAFLIFVTTQNSKSYFISAVRDRRKFKFPIFYEDVENKFVVTFNHKEQYEQYKEIEQYASISAKKTVGNGVPQLNTMVMEFNSEAEALAWAKGRDDIKLIEKDHIVVPASTYSVVAEVEVEQKAETTPYGIKYVNALDIPSYNEESGIKLCIIDSGYAVGHEDLPNPNEGAPVTGTSNLCGTACNWKRDSIGHGTHVAGTAVALENGKGVIGVVETGDMPLHIVRVFDIGSTLTSNVIAGIYDCHENGAHVVSMSLGSSSLSSLYQKALDDILGQNDQILFVAAAGNSGDDSYGWPASLPDIVSVGSITQSRERSGFSQYNNEVDLVAPGSRIKSTIPDGYGNAAGTSMATPHVSAVAAKVWSHYPSLTADQIRTILELNASDMGEEGRDDEYGWGLVDALAAYQALSGMTQPPSTKAPITPVTSPPTKAPTEPPTKTPTKNPTKVPTKNPTKVPTRAPIVSLECEDVTARFLFKGYKRTCDWVRDNPDQCAEYEIRIVCPGTCGSCELSCSDCPLYFYPFDENDKRFDCRKLYKQKTRRKKLMCKESNTYLTCPGVCASY